MPQTTTPSNVVSIASRQGKHTGPLSELSGYYEYWANKFPGGQIAKERDRLHRGLARHRTHRMVLRSTPPANAA